MLDLPIDPIVELYLGAWTPVVPRQNPPLQITRGSANEQTTIPPGRCSFTLNDPDGDYDRRNPTGAYYGLLGKNTRTRVRIPMLVDSSSQSVSDGWGTVDAVDAWTNNTAGSSGGTVADTDWSRSGSAKTHSVPAANAVRVSDLTPAGEGFLDSTVRFTVTLPTSTISGASVKTRVKFRALDDDNYVAVDFVFDTANVQKIGVFDRIDGANRRLLDDTAIDSNTATVFHCAAQIDGQVVRAKAWAGALPEPVDWSVETTRATVRGGYTGIASVVSSGNTNTKPFAMVYDDYRIESDAFHGEISEFEHGQDDKSLTTRWVRITASDLTQRYSQGQKALKSPMRRTWGPPQQRWIREGSAEAVGDSVTNDYLIATDADAADVAIGGFFRLLETDAAYAPYKEDQLFTVTGKTSFAGFTNIEFTPDALEGVVTGNTAHSFRVATAADAPVAYWPMEDGKSATQIASGLDGGPPMFIRDANTPPDFATNSSFAGSAPLLTLKDAELFGTIPDYTDTDQAFTLQFLVEMPETDEAATGQALVQFKTSGSVATWALVYATGGSSGDIVVYGFDDTGTQLFSHAWEMGLRGTPRQVVFAVYQDGSAVKYDLYATWLRPDNLFLSFGQTNKTATSATRVGKPTAVQVNPGGGYMQVGFGHLVVSPSQLTNFNVWDSIGGNAAENLPRRLHRLAYEENAPLTYCQGTVPAPRLAPQQTATLVDNFKAGAEVDMGLLYGAKGAQAFEYLARSTLYNQDATLTVDASNGELSGDFRPLDDDKDTRNEWTVTREGGSSATYTETEGPLSVLDPPDGAGLVDASKTIDAAFDTDLPDQASWRTHLGTVDEYRWPAITVSPVNGVSLARILSVNLGRRVVVTNAQAFRAYEDISQLVVGYTLTWDRYVPRLDINGTPERPYHTAVLDRAGHKLGSSASILIADYDAGTDTSFQVALGGSAVWSDTDGDFVVDVGGVQVNVTAVTGTSSPQTFTVDATPLNGLEITVPAGAAVRLAHRVYIPL